MVAFEAALNNQFSMSRSTTAEAHSAWRAAVLYLYTRQQTENLFIPFVPQQFWCLNMPLVFQCAASLAVPEMYPTNSDCLQHPEVIALACPPCAPWLHSDSPSEGRRTRLLPSLCPQWLLKKPQLGKMWVQIQAGWEAIMAQVPQFLDSSQDICWKAWDISHCCPQKKLIKTLSLCSWHESLEPNIICSRVKRRDLCAIIKIIAAVIDCLYINIVLQPQLRTQWDRNLQEQNKSSKNNFQVYNYYWFCFRSTSSYRALS